MRVVLLRSNDSRQSRETNITGVYPPLGLAYLASVILARGYDAICIDQLAEGLSENALAQRLKKFQPELICLSVLTPAWPHVLERAKSLKILLPNVRIVVGGAHLWVYPEESLQDKAIDFGVIGEGEEALPELLDRLKAKDDPGDIAGIVSKTGNLITMVRPRPVETKIDRIPFPAIGALPYRRYWSLIGEQPLFTMISSRGCPYHCRFCNQEYLGQYRARSPRNVVEEMSILANDYGVTNIVFFDETFTIERRRVIAICEGISDAGLRSTFELRTRIDLLDEELLEVLANAGCRRLHLGIESGDDSILERMGKGITTKRIERCLTVAKRKGFVTRGYFMLAYPGETIASIERTITFARRLPLDYASFSLTIGLPGSTIYEEGIADGTFPSDYWKKVSRGEKPDFEPYYCPAGLSFGDLVAIKRRAYLHFYLRPDRLLRLFGVLSSSLFSDKQRLFGPRLPAILRSLFSQ